MELKYPVAVYVGIGIAVIIPILFHWFKRKYHKGIKVANDQLVYELPQYRIARIKYRIYECAAIITAMATVLLASILIARPGIYKEDISKEECKDIFFCIDVSDSTNDCTVEMCQIYKELLEGFTNERVGITIFNGKSVVLVPLTTDYDAVYDALDKIYESIVCYTSDADWNDYSEEVQFYRYAGTLLLDGSGSSVISDGLASCYFSFTNLEDEERSRIILLSTDNDVNCKNPIMSLYDAAKLCADKDITIIGFSPEEVVDKKGFDEAMALTGGASLTVKKNNISTDEVKALLDDIEPYENVIKTVRFYDKPEAVFMGLIICIALHFACCWRIRL